MEEKHDLGEDVRFGFRLVNLLVMHLKKMFFTSLLASSPINVDYCICIPVLLRAQCGAAGAAQTWNETIRDALKLPLSLEDVFPVAAQDVMTTCAKR